VAFASDAGNLVPGDTNGKTDIFLHDLLTHETTRISVNSAGVQGNNHSYKPSISADGRYIAFGSWSSNLVSGDTNGWWDVFVHDRQTGKTTRVSVSSSGGQGNNSSGSPSISADGRYVAFSSGATNLVSGDTNGKNDIFVHDRVTRQTVRVNYTPSLNQGNDHSYEPFISPGGPYIVFESIATNLVAGDTNIKRDIFVIYPPSVLISPNGGEFIPSGSTHTIVWEAVPVAATFKLKYSLDGGLSWNSIPGAKGITGTSFDWIVPELAKNNAKCLMQLTAYDANGLKLGTDISDAPFTIGAVDLTTPSDPGISLTSGGSYDIQWTTYTTAVETVKLFYTLDASAVPVKWNLIQTFSGGSDPGIHTWPIPTVTKIKTKCMVKVVLKDVSGNNVAVDVSDSTFTIRPSLP
jgi:cold shock CspA family protein